MNVSKTVFQNAKRAVSTNQSVVRSIIILEYLARSSRAKDLAAISKDLSMNKSTVYRFLSTLADHGYVYQDPDTDRYRLGSKTAWLGSKFLESVDVRREARPFLEDLSSKSRETIHLGLLDREEIVYIEKLDGHGAIRMASRIGSRMPVHCTALGKALLATRPQSEWQEYVDQVGLEPRTENTITDPGTFYSELKRVRKRGVAFDNCENEDGIRCVAAPVLDHRGQAVAAVSVSGWTRTMTREKVNSLSLLVKNTALDISQRLGFQEQRLATSPNDDVVGKEGSLESVLEGQEYDAASD